MRVAVEVYRRGNCLEGRELSREIEELGIEEKYSVSVSKIYVIELDEDSVPGNSDERIKRIAGEILIDPVVEKYSVGIRSMEGVSVEVYFKKGVLDIAGRRAAEAAELAGLGEGLISVSSGDRYVISGSVCDMEKCRYISEKLFYNKVIQQATCR